jgi:hypothetical protein
MEEKIDLIKHSIISPVKEIFTDMAELGLDEIIEKIFTEQKLLQSIPILKWLLLGNDVRTIIQSAFFIQKYSNFIGPIRESMEEEITNNDKRKIIFSDERVLSKIIDQTIISLDRYQTIIKAKMLGILYVETFKNKNFTINEYNTLIFSIEYIHPYTGVMCLKSFYDYKIKMTKEKDKKIKEEIWMENSSLDYSPLVNTSLLILPHGGMYIGNYGGAFINALGSKFYELVVLKL